MHKIATAFIKAKREFSPALKDKTNPAFRSKYADLGACLEAVNEALLNNWIALTQRTHPDEHGVTVETVLMHESGETISSGPLHVPAVKQDAQGFGSAMTYARRYSLMAVCGIAPEDDDGSAASAHKPASAVKGAMGAVMRDEPALPEKRASYIDGLAGDLIDEHDNGLVGSAILGAIDAEKLNDTERMYLWSKLPSPVRSAIKTAEAAARKVAA